MEQNKENCNIQNDFCRIMIREMLDPSCLHTISMSELYENIYEKKPPIIDGLLYSGTYLFVDMPKVGKSFFMLQLAYHISTGTQLWNYTVNKGTVPYLALEDDYRRLQECLYRMFGADNYKIYLLLVHDTRKQKSEDAFDMISGTNGLLGAADGAFLIRKEKHISNRAMLEISRRDQRDQKIVLARNEEGLAWDFESAETELWKSPPDLRLEKIAEFVTAENPEWAGTATDLIEKIGTDTPVNAVTKKLNINASRILNECQICYQSNRSHDG